MTHGINHQVGVKASPEEIYKAPSSARTFRLLMKPKDVLTAISPPTRRAIIGQLAWFGLPIGHPDFLLAADDIERIKMQNSPAAVVSCRTTSLRRLAWPANFADGATGSGSLT